MKKITFSILMLCAVVIVNAQEFKPFKVDISTGYAIPSGKGSKGGVLFVVEPKYAVMDALSVGLRMEAAVMARGSDLYGDNASVDVKAAASYLLTGDYYFSSNKARPFAGAGVGIFSLASASVNSTTETSGASSKFGGMIRAGVELGHFRFGVEYNLVPSSDVAGFDTNGNPTTGKAKNGYIGIKIGGVIGGGRK
jgi:outer membrane protein W